MAPAAPRGSTGRAATRARAAKATATGTGTRRGAASVRTSILDAARELIRTGGFPSLSFADIGLAVGVSDEVVRRHFPDTNAILVELLDDRPPATDGRRADRDTKAEIVAVARRLFGERGFHAIAVDDLAREVGITGPAVYRHFDSKEDILAAALNSLLGEAAERVWGDGAPGRADDTVEAALARDVEFVVEHAGLVTLWQSEWRHLKPAARAHNIAIQRRYVSGFIELLLRRRPELSADRAETMMVAVLALIMGAAVHPHNRVAGAELRDLLTDMAVASLGLRYERRI